MGPELETVAFDFSKSDDYRLSAIFALVLRRCILSIDSPCITDPEKIRVQLISATLGQQDPAQHMERYRHGV